MHASIHPLPVAAARRPSRSPLARRIARRLRRWWLLQCRRAERRDRVVPYY